MRGANEIDLDQVAGQAAAATKIDLDDGTDQRARRLLSSLPRDLRLHNTRARYPHVLNQVAADWDVPRRFLALMESLLLDTRGGRQGFAFDTVVELLHLRQYYLDEVHPELRRPVDRRDPSVWY